MARSRSEAGRATYRVAYDRMLARWPTSATTRIVPGRLADTHVIDAGFASGAPLLLLPAVSVSAAAFLPLVPHLPGRRVIAADVPGAPASPSRTTGCAGSRI